MDNNQIRALVERIEHIDADIKNMNADKADIFKEAKGNGFDVKALKEVIRRRRKAPGELAEIEALVELYESALEPPPTHARAREDKPLAVVR